MRRILLTSIIALILIGGVVALGGARLREDDLIDPYDRQKYFGEGYQKPLVGYGLKNAPRGNFGAKGFNGGEQAFTNAIISQGRNPGRVSHYDSGYRGYKIMDKIVELEGLQTYTRANLAPANSRATARVFTTQRAPITGLPQSSLILRAENLPPLNKDEVYEVWLFDEDSGYSLTLGILQSGLSGASSTAFGSLAGTHGNMLSENGAYDFTMYESIAITKEPFPDNDPHPGDIILIGDLTQ